MTDAVSQHWPTLYVWRHPAVRGVAGRCIGRTDLPVDARKAKRLARRIQRFARRQGLPREIWTSDLARSHAVGRWLARWGWRHRISAGLAETDFGTWDGQLWTTIAHPEIDAWAQDLMQVRPGGGESVAMLLARVAAQWQRLLRQALVVSHGGWMSAARWLAGAPAGLPTAANWPRAPRHGERWTLVRG